MESRQRNSWWTVGIGSVALALLLLGGTAAFADGQQCYSCGSWCTEQGAIYGMWYDNAPNTPRWVRVGGAGFPDCNPGTNCFFAVSAACTQQCDRCIAAGGHYGGPVMDYRVYHAINVFVFRHDWIGGAVGFLETWAVPVFGLATFGLWFLARPGGPRKWKLASASALAKSPAMM